MADNTTESRIEDRIVRQARKEYEAGLKFRHDREKQWQLNEDFYFNRVKRNIKGKFNVPVPIVPGFVDTWTGKMHKHVNIDFSHTESADYMAAKKVSAFYAKLKTKGDYDFDMADTDGKKMNAIYGRAIYGYQADSMDGYHQELQMIDPYDFYIDPLAGSNMEKALYQGQDNIFRSKSELVERGNAKIYVAEQVTRLVNATKDEKLRDNDTSFASKQNRLMAMDLNGISHNYAGQSMYKLIEHITTFGGKRWYVLFDYATGIWVRCQPLTEVFKSDLFKWTSWAANRDSFNFWSKAPVDDIIPVAETIRVLVNQELDNRSKRNYNMRGYDPDMFPEPAELEWRQDGLVRVKSGSTITRPIAQGLYEFETPELQGTINLVNWMDGMLKEKTGINSEAQGQTDTGRVGIAFLNVQQSAERLQAIQESYAKCWEGIGRRFLWGLTEHMRKSVAVRILGEQGEQWEELRRREVNPEWDIEVTGGIADANSDELKKKAARETLSTLTPDELAVTNPKMRARIKFEAAEVDDDIIRQIFDMTDETSREVLSKASQMIQDVLKNKPVKLYRGATAAFLQKILDYATDNDLSLEDYTKLIDLIDKHRPIAVQNMGRMALQEKQQQRKAAVMSGNAPVGVAPEGSPAPVSSQAMRQFGPNFNT